MKDKCIDLLNEYFKLGSHDLQLAFNERGYGNKEKGQKMVDQIKERKAEIEAEIFKMIAG